ncbi:MULTISPECIES: amidohydrolase family protein [unclassified Modestobacter]|uniref:amidohydrolase family protein n=1 Tax=unclassified Modestobacter TaxID=2643866 RepID=UPI0022AAA3A0|nr:MULTISPECIES: amidohydrolase family protein [unclassified Modestobacter]MCZ2826621.1 amidohydrolase family protein [Modestobacter sp. VKM Ac-2981]MCZ2855001.1 amidohydrolase family protein [Modestobacter sp. VKM Ac-2982]
MPVLLRGLVLPVLADPVPRGAVVVEDGVITYVGPASRAPHLTGEVTEVDAGDGAVVPGMIDAHVHLVADGAADFAGSVVRSSTEQLAARAAANARRTLAAGTVAVRDLGAPDGIAISLGHQVAAGRVPGPEITAAGRALTAPGGHIPYLGVEVQGPAELAAAARAELTAGAGGIKLVATGGVLTPGSALGNAPFAEDELAAAAAVARAQGRWVAAHAIGHEGTKLALRAGATSVEHGYLLDDETVTLMATTGAVLVTTQVAVARMLRNRDLVDPAVVARAEEIRDVAVASLRRAARAGIPIAGASDAGTPFNPHGGVAEEAALLVADIGLTTAQALRAVTATAASCLLRPDLGHLSVGAPGHVVVTGADPLDDVTALTDVRTVVLGGRLVDIPERTT